MYRIYADDQLLYSDTSPDISHKLISPNLQLKDNAAGALTATVPPGHPLYDSLECMATTIDVIRIKQNKSEEWLWRGRILKIEKDFWKQKKITCEGALAFFNDTVMPLRKDTYSIEQFVGFLLDVHNAKVNQNRRILKGAISSTSSSGAGIGFHEYLTEGDTVMSHLSTLLDDWGLHARIRKANGNLYLDMLTDTQLVMSPQTINFGKNLLDYSDENDWSNFVSVILPLGGDLDTNSTTGDEEHPDRVVIDGLQSSVPDFTVVGSYLVNNRAVQEHGRIEQTVEWNDIEEPEELLSLAELYLKDYEYVTNTLKVTAFDLHYLLGSGVQPFGFLNQINCYSKPHGLYDTFITTEMTIPFDSPDNTKFTMTRSSKGLYGSDRSGNGVAHGKLSAASSHIPSKEGILRAARENAAAMIDMATNGYVTLVSITEDDGDGDRSGDRTWAITITNAIDMESSTQMWKWTLGGLEFVERSSISDEWGLPKLALTMDGQIVATRITTGTLAVDDGNGGYLLLADMDSGTMQVAGFDFASDHFWHDKSSLDDDDTNGIWFGLDGIAIGQTGSALFKVDVNSDTAFIMINKTSLDDDTNGVYVGTDGIAVGESGASLFKVDVSGETAYLMINKTSLDDDSNAGVYIGVDGIAVGGSGNGLLKIDVSSENAFLMINKTSPMDTATGVYIGNDGIGIGGEGQFYIDTDTNAGKILGFFFLQDKIYTLNRSNFTGNIAGLHLSADGFSSGNGQYYIGIGDGKLTGGDNSERGYVSFTSASTVGSQQHGIRLAGRGFVGCLTGDWFGIGPYADSDSGVTLYKGISRNVTIPAQKTYEFSPQTASITIPQGINISSITRNGDGAITDFSISFANSYSQTILTGGNIRESGSSGNAETLEFKYGILNNEAGTSSSGSYGY